MSNDDVKANASACKKALGVWGIAATSDGKVMSSGYGNVLMQGNYLNCGHNMLVMTGRDNSDNLDF